MPQPIFSARYFIFALLAVFFALGVYEMMPSLTPATAEEAFDEVPDGSMEVGGVGQTGMPASNARVRPILAKHRNQFVVVCVAGCKGQASPVQFLPKPVRKRSGLFVPAAFFGGTVAESNDVICLAGCDKKAGQVVQRMGGLRNK
ncbi:MAG: hypothetical protein V3T13_01655 [Hyphomicrobium sp.]